MKDGSRPGKHLVGELIEIITESELGLLRTEGKRAEDWLALAARVLESLNRSTQVKSVINDILNSVKEYTGLQSVGVRLREGDDFPYFATVGFSKKFVMAENYLLARDESGEPILDSGGTPLLECMCGKVISGRTNPSLSFFTEGGSFWTNSTTELLSSATKEDLQECKLSLCNKDGYESVALIPVRSNDETIGLLQLNDRRDDVFTPGGIRFFEKVASSVGIALAKMRFQEALRESEGRYKAIVESSVDGIAIVQGTKMVFVNRALLKMFGYKTEDEMVGHEFTEFVAPECRSIMVEKGLARERGEDVASRYEFKGLRRDGTQFDAEISVSVVFYNGAAARQGVVRDITRQKWMDKEKRRMEAEVRQSQKMEAMGRLAGGIAHDFNNLLTAIRGYTDLASMKTEKDSVAHPYLNEIREASIRGANLTRQLLLFSRRQPVDFKPMDINRAVSSLLGMLKRVIGENYVIVTDLDSDIWTVIADSGHIEQIVMNMVVNAKDAMPGGGEISINTRNLYVDEEYCRTHDHARPGKSVCLSIGDKGIGMDTETIDHIFEPFFSTREPTEGTGLGLSVVYGIVKQHRGWIVVESIPGKGSTFRICFPATSETIEEQGEETPSIEKLRGAGERILLVEDEEDVKVLAERILRESGYVVLAARDAEEALKIFEAEKGNFDIVFSDVVLPDQSGLNLVGSLLRKKPGLGVLLASGYNQDATSWRRIRERGYRFIQKPYVLPVLLRVIRELLGKS